MSSNTLEQGARKKAGRRRPAPCHDELMPTPEEIEDDGQPILSIRMPVGGFTVADLLAMPEYPYRIELTDGALTVSPSPSGLHQRLGTKLLAVLCEAEANGYVANHEVDVVLSKGTTRIPDVMIVRDVLLEGPRVYTKDELAVAVEIESPGSTALDRKLKPLVYAEYGVPQYWRIELEPELIATIYRLEDGAYTEVSRGPRIEVTEPFPFSVNLADLMRRGVSRGRRR
ncbi:Uma2 family endonuclease [Cryptosporangium aurantiacum]|uniref:Endonuclease, Uma2 family (Restriction endonuclease fold) n=1 Tax=Cryptosporangium aurantiacum TaxID=134849 RepID=A0A1M7QRS0_9ACTN|nr:Uma2 family endonuclease [Cryptosporangium aurantiacum]SHN34341.1 Endonuclease, Uma2 family (restriction endonuclease fold) [Cryptosporangium aurantiacum]